MVGWCHCVHSAQWLSSIRRVEKKIQLKKQMNVFVFCRENDEEILANVVNKTIDFGLLPKVSFECRDALTALLERNPNRRMTASQLLQHPWIKVRF